MPAAQTWDSVSEGQEFETVEASDSQRLVIWAAASGDFYQIHYDDNFAKNNKLPDIIVHGALKGMWVGKLLDEIAGDDGWVKQWDVSYRGMDIAREDVTIFGKITKKYEQGGEHLIDLEVGVRRKDGSVSTPGTGTVRLKK
ncbi:MAG: MaoC/PaaZ C-terminal domain-containing protein [Dehalococcoidia bacterium]|jgi:acyl dehydratase|nr:MaoC/PaaZ C-terminal domain-containing protein [Dehalococcoidia bacterium]